jgi:hypothetical protein
MRDWVSEWVQDGSIYVWRYKEPNRHWRGWHFSGDPAGCRSIRNLLDRMRGGEACHRTLKLGAVTERILSVPNYQRPTHGRFRTLRLDYSPEATTLTMQLDEERLILTVGPKRITRLTAAFAEVEVGLGDFGIATSDDRKADHWMFWWMPKQDDENR